MSQSNDVRSVERWGQTPLDLNVPQVRFRLSRWSYFYKDPESGLVMGQCEGETTVTEPGDTLLVMRGRPTTISAKERTRVVFVCFPLHEIEQCEAAMRQGVAQIRR